MGKMKEMMIEMEERLAQEAATEAMELASDRLDEIAADLSQHAGAFEGVNLPVLTAITHVSDGLKRDSMYLQKLALIVKPLSNVAMIVLFLGLSACSSLRLKDFNQVETGMSRAQVEDILGEPSTVRGENGRTILEYVAKDDNDEDRTRIVVLEDREVIFFGKPSDYKAQQAAQNGASGTNTSTVTVSPSINPTFSPVFNNYAGGSSVAGPPASVQAPNPSERLIWMHESPAPKQGQ